MSETLTVLANQFIYLFTNLTLINVLDILLVAAFFFVIFQALYQTRALQVLRGALIIAILGVALLLLIPLETVRLLVQGLLIAGVISLPILFQTELRRALTGLGQIGTRRENGSTSYQFEDSILTAVEQLSTRLHGALIVLEGATPLDDIIETGIQMRAQPVTTELLTTIFYPNTSLHDGAVVLRGDQLMAAACILPVQKEQTESEHLGTRHRAALGLSFQIPDAIVIVISEETGGISVSQAGRIHRVGSMSELEEWLKRFRKQVESRARIHWSWLRSGGPKIIITNILVALTLSLVAWVSVTFQTNPPITLEFTDVLLSVIPPSSDVVLINEPPDTVVVKAQSTTDRMNTLSSSSINAQIDLSELSEGSQNVPVTVSFAEERVELISVTPPQINVILENFVQKELVVNIEITGDDSLPLGYELAEYSGTPEVVTIQGADSRVAGVTQARATIDVSGRTDDFQIVAPVELINQEGDLVEGIVPSPQQILVEVAVNRNFSTRTIAVQAVWDPNTLEDGYQITGAIAKPNTVTLKGQPRALQNAGVFIQTATVDLSNAQSDFTTLAPLIAPDGVTILDADGNEMLNVFVTISIEPETGYLSTRRRIVFRGLNSTLNASTVDSWVSVLLFGPLPALAETENDPNLVTVYADLTAINTPGAYTIPLEYEAPQDLSVEIFPAEVEIRVTEAQ